MAIVQTSYGAVRGAEENGLHYFRGIPYAKPPLGALRFHPPQKHEGWSGVRDASRYAPACLQGDRPLAPLLGIVVPEASEDCLYLNVCTPAPDGARRPVFVWIHGGAWVIGGSSEDNYNPTHLVERGDCVVVTINYRLGLFGGLRGRDLPGSRLDSTGNEGLLDAVAALQWVQDEIVTFGGDPRQITVGGESAGSVNVGCLMSMPQAQGLFQRAVMESGAPGLLRTPEQTTRMSEIVFEELGIAPNEAEKLYTLSSEQLLDAQNRATRRAPDILFAPVADGDVVPANPFAAIGAGASGGVPLLLGTNLEEMKLYRFLDPGIDTLTESQLEQRCSAVFPGTDADGVPHGRRAVETYRAARAARGEDISPAELWLAVSTDQVFRAGALRFAELHAAHTPQSYVYLFTWRASAPDKPQGAIHALDLPFVWGTLDETELGRMAGRSAAAHELSRQMQGAWLAFIRSGDPNGEGLPRWDPYAPPRRATMLFGEQSHSVDAPLEQERAFWAPFLR